MKLHELGEVELRYLSIESLDFGSGGQIYGELEGTVTGERLRGSLRMTNLADAGRTTSTCQRCEAS